MESMMRSSLDFGLVGAEGSGLLQELVHERGFAMIDVGDDGDVANVFHICGSGFFHFSSERTEMRPEEKGR